MESITIKDVARICEVGVSTVSRAINNHPDINKETKTKIMNVIKEYNYIPNNSARNLKRSDSKTIAVLIKGISNPFFSGMIKVFEREIQKKKYSFILHRVDEKEDEVDMALELVKEKRLKGIVFLGGSFHHTRERLGLLGVPFVLSTIGMPQKAVADICSSVAVDDYKESYKMADYLCSLGHKKIAVLAAYRDDNSIGKLRIEGYRDALIANGIRPDNSLCVPMKDGIEGYSMANGYAMMKELLNLNRNFTAVYAISDSLAIGACKAIYDMGKKIPEDLSLAGFDGLDITQYYHPSITTIRQPVEQMAEATIKILFEDIRSKTQHQHLVFKGELVVGESTRTIKGE